MPPGLYEIVITEKPGTKASSQGEAGDFDLSIEERGLDDIRALGCNSLEDERVFAAVARVSELNNALYQTFMQPWIKMMSGPQLASAAVALNPVDARRRSCIDRTRLASEQVPLSWIRQRSRSSPSVSRSRFSDLVVTHSESTAALSATRSKSIRASGGIAGTPAPTKCPQGGPISI
jgi:hypothetical protein